MKHERHLPPRPTSPTNSKRASPLAPLSSYDPEKIVGKTGNSSLEAFILALGLAFNDLKGLSLWAEKHSESKPLDTVISTESGEWHGRNLQIHRLMVGQTYELLKLIKEFEEVATGPEIRRLLKHADKSVRAEWTDLVRVATDKGTPRDKAFALVLLRTRNNASYHYYQPKALINGFRSWFFDAPPSAHNKTAFASVGINMTQTRFYFVDAAVQGALMLLTEPTVGAQEFAVKLRRTMESVNEVLAHIVRTYIKFAKVNR